MKHQTKGISLLIAAICSLTIFSCNDDEGDNGTPNINNQTFSIVENAPNGTVIETVEASDPDGDELTFEIFAGNESGAFELDQNSGQLSVADSEELDFETNPSFELTIEVSDGELMNSAVITVNVADVSENNAPVIENQTLEISENAGAGAIGNVVATDDESTTMLFSVVSGNEDDIFSLSDDGIIALEKPEALDFETTNSYTLTIEVSDGQLTDQADVTINVKDVSEDGSITFEGESYQLIDGSVLDYGPTSLTSVDSHYNLDFVTTDGVLEWDADMEDYMSDSWSFAIYCELFSNGKSFEDGTFSFVDEDDLETGVEGKKVFAQSLIAVDGNGNNVLFESEDDIANDKYYMVTDGTIRVIEDGDEYTLMYDVTVVELDYDSEEPIGEEFSLAFSYTGVYKYADVSARSARSMNASKSVFKK